MILVEPIAQEHVEEFVDITTAAFPGMGIHKPKDRQRFLERLSAIEDDLIRSI